MVWEFHWLIGLHAVAGTSCCFAVSCSGHSS